ncbi:MAG TPA: hypothetical protein VGI47_03595 [Candidatus Binataceae bacterium]
MVSRDREFSKWRLVSVALVVPFLTVSGAVGQLTIGQIITLPPPAVTSRWVYLVSPRYLSLLTGAYDSMNFVRNWPRRV